MPPGDMRRRVGLLVSIHDVTPAFETAVARLWTMCRAQGVTPALLVVPDWHGQWRLNDHPHYLSWLRAAAGEGAEVVLHGLRHDEAGLPRTAIDHLRAAGRTNREGEFLTLDTTAARGRIAAGLEALREAGLRPTGFVPPAWLAREATHQAVREAGLDFSEDAGSVRLHATNRRLSGPVIRWSARSTWRAATSAAVAAARFHLLVGHPLVRIALHPQDLDHPIVAASVAQELTRWLERGRQVRYDSL